MIVNTVLNVVRSLILLISVIPFYGLQNQSEEDISLMEFRSGHVTKYSSYGLDKSRGLKAHIKYPKSWDSIEGERPHIIRKFAQPGGTVLAIVQIIPFDFESTKDEIDQFFENEFRVLYPSDYQIISVDNNMKIEGLRSGAIEYKRSSLRSNQSIYSHNLDFVTIYKSYQLSVLFMVTDKLGESKKSVDARFDKLEPLFMQMINSIVIDNVWE